MLVCVCGDTKMWFECNVKLFCPFLHISCNILLCPGTKKNLGHCTAVMTPQLSKVSCLHHVRANVCPDFIQHLYVFIPVSSEISIFLYLSHPLCLLFTAQLSVAAGGYIENWLGCENSERLIHYCKFLPLKPFAEIVHLYALVTFCNVSVNYIISS